jgi:hypothetical protein
MARQRKPLDVEEIVRLYLDERLWPREIAARFGTTAMTVRSRLREAGVYEPVSQARDPGERYLVHLCARCAHPGGQHRLDDGCRCGFCGGWEDAGEGYWSDAMTRQLEIDAGITREDGDG